jgi:hypothetical protein
MGNTVGMGLGKRSLRTLKVVTEAERPRPGHESVEVTVKVHRLLIDRLPSFFLFG